MNLKQKFNKFIRKNKGKYSKSTIERVGKFIDYEINNPNKRRWDFFKETEDFFVYYRIHPEWEGKSTKEITKLVGGYAFYGALSRFARKQSHGNIKKHRKIIQKVFKLKLRDWSSFLTIEGFVKEYNKHPEWQGKSTEIVQKDKESGGLAFYEALQAFARKKSNGDKKIQKELVQNIFKPMRRDWSSFTKIEDFVKEYNKHPEWQGKSTGVMQKDNKFGGSGFYGALLKFIKKESRGNENRRKAYLREIFPERKAPFDYNFGKEIVYFDSAPERIIGFLLNKYGLIRKFVEGENIHILTNNGWERNSIDFLIDKTFIEYHPLSFSDISKSLTLKDIIKKKKVGISKPKYKNFDFFLIWDIDQLYNVLKDKKIDAK